MPHATEHAARRASNGQHRRDHAGTDRRISHAGTTRYVTTCDRYRRPWAVRDAAPAQVAVPADEDSFRPSKVTAVRPGRHAGSAAVMRRSTSAARPGPGYRSSRIGTAAKARPARTPPSTRPRASPRVTAVAAGAPGQRAQGEPLVDAPLAAAWPILPASSTGRSLPATRRRLQKPDKCGERCGRALWLRVRSVPRLGRVLGASPGARGPRFSGAGPRLVLARGVLGRGLGEDPSPASQRRGQPAAKTMLSAENAGTFPVERAQTRASSLRSPACVMLGMPGSKPGQRRGPGSAVSPHGGRGSAPPEVSPAAETPGLERQGPTPARGSLTGPHHGRIRGQPSREGQRGGQRRHYAVARWSGQGFNGVFYAPRRARTTRPGAEPGSTLKSHEPRRASPGTGALASWWWVTPIRPAREIRRATPACGVRRAMPRETVSPRQRHPRYRIDGCFASSHGHSGAEWPLTPASSGRGPPRQAAARCR
jgi:hypothetical protein